MNWCRETRAYKEKITTSSEIGQTVNSFARYARRRGDQAGGGSGEEEGRGGGSEEGDQWWVKKMVTDSTLTFKAHLCRMQP